MRGAILTMLHQLTPRTDLAMWAEDTMTVIAMSGAKAVRQGGAVAVRIDAGKSRESFAVAVESNAFDDPAEVRRIKHAVAHAVVSEMTARPRRVVVLEPGTVPKTPSGKLRRATSHTVVG